MMQMLVCLILSQRPLKLSFFLDSLFFLLFWLGVFCYFIFQVTDSVLCCVPHIYTNIYMCVFMYMCVCVYVYTHTHIHTHKYIHTHSYTHPQPRTFFHCFQRRRERNIDTRKKHQLVTFHMCLTWGSYAPRPGIEPATLVCVLTRNQTHNLLVMG